MIKEKFIEFVYKQNIIELGTVKLKNGDYSDHHYNFGNIETPKALLQCSKWFIKLIGDTQFNVIFTSAYKGIALQTGLALEYNHQFPHKNIKFGYQRKEYKSHGKNDIIGYCPQKGDKVLLLDDVFTTGNSINEMIKFVKSFGAIPILIVVAILRVNEKELSVLNYEIPIKYFAHDDEIIAVYNQYRNLSHP